MKRIKTSILLIALLFSIGAMAQEKVIDKSSRRPPKWYQGAQEGYMISFGEGADISEAKEKALISLRTDIVSSVATYVKSASDMSIENINKNNVVSTTERFKNNSSVISADVPFLKGISLNKAQDYYWVKYQHKKTKKVRVEFHVLYPFSQLELNQLIKEFDKQDKQMTEEMNSVIEEAATTNSVETLIENAKQLMNFEQYFLDARKEKAKLERNRILGMLENIIIVPEDAGLDYFKYSLRIGNKIYTSARKPRLKSAECITANLEPSGMYQLIKFTHEYCYEDDENFVEVKYKFSNTNVSHKFVVDVTAKKADIFIKDVISVKPDGSNASAEINLFSKYDGEVIINKVELEWKGKSPIVFRDVNKSINKKGLHVLQLIGPADVSVIETGKVNGTVYYTIKATGEQARYRIFNQKVRKD